MREEYSEITKSSLCPVGVGYSEHLTYFLSPKGEMFGGLTRSDFDGLMCAVLLKNLNLFGEKLFVHPKDMQFCSMVLLLRISKREKKIR